VRVRKGGLWRLPVMRLLFAFASAALALALVTPAVAGPPYVTDDPAPTDEGHWEIYNFANGAQVDGATAGQSGLDLNYGAAKNLQLTVVIPAAYDTGQAPGWGFGTIEAAAKFRIFRGGDDSWAPDVAFFPRAFLPTASAGFGSDRVSVLLPIWIGKDHGDWSWFGGGGWQWNPGPGNQSFWTGGLTVTRNLTKDIAVGGELYGHTRDSVGGRDFAGLNIGADWKFARHWSVLASGGPGIVNAASEGQWDFYLALKADY
jgi:hypothetical protein